jgi:Holliday junction resolvasome RuvABC endonuclease subunit
MLSKTSKAYEQISSARLGLTEGWVIAIDPSIGSSSSLPGYAVYRGGKLLISGVLQIDRNADVPTRLQQLAYEMRRLYAQYPVDVLVYEDIPAQRYGGGNANAHSSLLKSVGVVLSISGPASYVGLLPISWKRLVREGYVKGDKEDAEEIGYIAISEARRITEEEGRKPGRKYGSSKSK